ncbi:hypothetical protein BDV96DRAFT_227189 [Lophiotrema nucula]|uniref:DUF7730 domain-containing protein n=1 Tax=Lophiotrema nucula TaxID=690887 RepID=A0A6A5YRN6_9PLEO|nr:hypothetical protein BDV96DRAFT_227189 [Lophiotrema nucula]
MGTRMRPFHDVMASTVTPSRALEAGSASEENEDEVEDVIEFTPPYTIVNSINVCFDRVYPQRFDKMPWYIVVFEVLIFCPYTLPSTIGKYVYKKSKPRFDQLRTYCVKEYEKTERHMITSKRKEYVVMTRQEKEREEARRRAKRWEMEKERDKSKKENKFPHIWKRLKGVSFTATRRRNSKQTQSRFLQLPIDIRMMIYDYLLPSAKAVHIVFHGNRIRSLLCKYPQQEWGEGCYCRYMEGCQVNGDYSEDFKMTTGVRNLHVLLTVCRSMNVELLSYFYRTKMFKFHTPESLLLFGETNPSALENMTSIHIDGRQRFESQNNDFSLPLMFLSKPLSTRYKDAHPLPRPINLAVYHLSSSRTAGAPVASAWGAACIRLSELQSLTNLKVHLSKKLFGGLGRAIIDSNTWHDDEVDKFVLEPLSEVHERLGKQLQAFEVVLDWQGERGVKDARKSRKRWGFVVKRLRVVGKHPPVDVWPSELWRSLVYGDEGEQVADPSANPYAN